MKIIGIEKITLIDYPDKISTTLFTPGCNMRCPYCHNKGIVFNYNPSEIIPVEEILSILEDRKKFIDSIVITGGEPTLQLTLIEFMRKIRNRFDFCIKLDTNGLKPAVIQQALSEKLVDYVAMDLKTDFNNYRNVLQVDGELVKQTYLLLKNSGVEYELRMTCYPDFIDNNTIDKFCDDLDINDVIKLQQCNIKNNKYTKVQLKEFKSQFEKKGFKFISIRK